MRFLSPIKANMKGFTLIEVLIIAPIVIIAISGFIALIITMVGDVLAVRDRNTMTYEIRDSLDHIEQDTRLSTQFLTSTVNIQAPQGSNDGTTPFSNTNSLILGALATDKNPVDSTRQLVFYAKQPNDCGALEFYNRPLIGKVIYFIKSGSLWRRSYLPPYNTNVTVNDETVCKTPWQLNSCSPGYVSSRCQTNDTELMRNITAFSVKYYATPQSTAEIGAANALTAGSIEVSLTGQKSIAGRSITQSGTVRVAKLNNIDADLPIPTAPNITAQTGANSINFSWDAVPAATSYLVRYNIDGGGWTNTTLDSTTTNYTIPQTLYRNQSATIEVQAKNTSGTSPAGTAAATMPLWTACDLLANWKNYGGLYATAAYTKTNADVIVLKGLIYNGTTTANTPMCILPDGYRPAKRLVFITSSQNGGISGTGRIDIAANGEVRFVSGTNGWIALDGIRFVSSASSYTWSAPPLQNGWTDTSTTDPAPHETTLDNKGRVHMRGVVTPGTTTAGTVMFLLPAGQTKNGQFNYIAASAANGFSYIGVGGTGGANIDVRTNPGTQLSVQAMFYPYTYGGWINIPDASLSSGWVWINLGNHATPSYTKSADGIVTLKGIIKKGVNDDGTLIYTLPAGYRPKEQLVTSCVAFGAYCRVDIMPDGRIIDNASANNGWLSLDNISFMAEQ